MKHLTLFFLLFLVSCTFNPDGVSFVEVEQKVSNEPLKLVLSPQSDSIVLFGATDISFSLNLAGEKFSTAVIKYYDKEIKTDNRNFTFQLVPDSKYDWSDLTIDFYVSSGTGSIADKLNVEHQKVTKTYKIKYFNIHTIGLRSNYRIHKDGYLQVYIVKIKGLTGVKYELSSHTAVDSSVSGDTIFYNMKNHIHGYFYAWFSVIDKNSSIIYTENLSNNIPAPKFEIDELLEDSCVLKCTYSPIKCYYGLNGKILQGTSAKWKLPYIFNYSHNVILSVYPPSDFQGMNQSSFISVNVPMLGNQSNYTLCYALQKDQFYLSADADKKIVLGSKLPLPLGTEWQGKNKMIMACSSNANYIAGYYNSKIVVFDENIHVTMEIDADPITNQRKFIVTNDGVCTYLKGSQVVMKNIASKVWSTFTFTSNADPRMYVNYVSNISVSIDGNYVCIRGENDFKVYDVSNHQTAKVCYVNNIKDDILAVYAHPTNPQLVYVKKLTSIELHTLPDFELVKTINIPLAQSVMHTIDPYSNIIVLSSGEYYYFLNADSGAIVYKLRSKWSLSDYVTTLNHYQLGTGTRLIDLTKYLKK